MSKVDMLISDSGGIQEEAPSIGKPNLVLRDHTERPEAISAGTVILVGTNEDLISSKANDLLNDNKMYEKMSILHNPYGDGKASEKIVKFLIKKIQ